MTGVQGHLKLTCSRDSEGRCYLRQQSFSVPVHLSKPYLDNGVLVVNVVTPTAGYFSGDRCEVQVRVESGARLLLTAPSAQRVHRMKSGQAELTQNFFVAAQGHLEIWPELFIPQAGANYVQKTRIEIEKNGELLFIETVAPGRVASGEVFEFSQLKWQTDIIYDGTRIVRERYLLSPNSLSLASLKSCFPAAYHGTCFVIGERLDGKAKVWREITNLQCADLRIGCSQLVRGGASIKIIARDSITLRKGIGEVRTLLYQAAGWDLPAIRRI